MEGVRQVSHELSEGLELDYVEWDDERGKEDNFYRITGTVVGKITVSMQAGQMGMVPWALVTDKDGKKLALVNLAKCRIVEIKDE
jgi:hypothetical protein